MNSNQFSCFESFRTQLKNYCAELNSAFADELSRLQKDAAKADTPDYPIENPVVYNTALDEISLESNITKIIIGDNPGKNEQLNCNQKYLIGQAGKLAAGFFQKNPEFKTDFRKNVIILNKTPVHSAKTKHLISIIKIASPELKSAVTESSLWMARKTAELHQNLCKFSNNSSPSPELWLVGYGELKGKGIFADYKNQLKSAYLSDNDFQDLWNNVMVFQHFSMNRFSIDLDDFMKKNGLHNKMEALKKLGEYHRQEIFI